MELQLQEKASELHKMEQDMEQQRKKLQNILEKERKNFQELQQTKSNIEKENEIFLKDEKPKLQQEINNLQKKYQQQLGNQLANLNVNNLENLMQEQKKAIEKIEVAVSHETHHLLHFDCFNFFLYFHFHSTNFNKLKYCFRFELQNNKPSYVLYAWKTKRHILLFHVDIKLFVMFVLKLA